MLFVIFDLEAVFIFAWAIAFRELGWGGYFGALVFIGVLVAALSYAWRLGLLDWGSKGRKATPSARRSVDLQNPEQEDVVQENVS